MDQMVKADWIKYMRWLFRNLYLNGDALFILSVVFFLSGCGGDESPSIVKPPDSVPKQYDQAFENVPGTADIAMYEVNVQASSSTGDLNGVKARLDEIKTLGINVIWLMPVYPTGELNGVGSPYAVKNYTEINPTFGNLEDLRSLVKEAHARDMAVILDWVANHTAWDNPWIQNRAWYTKDASGNIISPAGMGWNDVADLDYNNTAMRREMIKAMKYWVLEANVDGYRCDYAEGVPTDFWRQAIDTLRNIPNRKIIMFAEAGKKELFSAGFDLIFGWNFYSKLKEVFNNNASASGLITVNTADYNNIPEGSHILRWTTNHDDHAWDDSPVAIFKGQEGSIAAFVLAAYVGGVPLIYSGQEVGSSGTLPFFTNSSTKINWTANHQVLEEYQKLLNFRSTSNAVKNGSLQTYNTADIMAFKRVSGSEEVLVVVNVRHDVINYQIPAALENTSWHDAFTDHPVTLNTSISLDPFSYMILKN